MEGGPFEWIRVDRRTILQISQITSISHQPLSNQAESVWGDQPLSGPNVTFTTADGKEHPARCSDVPRLIDLLDILDITTMEAEPVRSRDANET